MIATYLTIGLPSLMVLVDILMNRDAVSVLRADINRLDARMTKLEDNMTSGLGEMSALRVSFHNDVAMLLERDNKLALRVAQLERASQPRTPETLEQYQCHCAPGEIGECRFS